MLFHVVQIHLQWVKKVTNDTERQKIAEGSRDGNAKTYSNKGGMDDYNKAGIFTSHTHTHTHTHTLQLFCVMCMCVCMCVCVCVFVCVCVCDAWKYLGSVVGHPT